MDIILIGIENVQERRIRMGSKDQIISRKEYYTMLDNRLKNYIKGVCLIKYKNLVDYNEYDIEDIGIDSSNNIYTPEGEFSLYIYFGATFRVRIEERAFDKFYLPMFNYSSKAEVEYRKSDVEITINNIKHILLNQFAKHYFVN